jgi:outer membrane protein TolC
MKLCSFIIFLVFSASLGHAMDLAGMQALALNNREVIQQYMAVLEQSEQEIVRAKGGYYPAVDVSDTSTSLDHASLFEEKNSSVFLSKISWNIFAGFRDKYNLQSAELLQKVEQYKLQGIRQDLQLIVAIAYLLVFERRANLTVAESAFQTLGKIYRDGESRYQVGLIGKNELLKFRVDYDNADISLKSADADLKKSINDLSRQVGSVIDLAELDFADFQTLPPLVDRTAYVDKMLAGRSEIKALEAAIAATSAQVEAARSGYYPRVDAAGSYRRNNSSINTENISIDNEELRAELTMSINLFQGRTTEATVAKTQLQSRAQQYELAELKNSLVTELDNLFIDFQVSLDNVVVAKRSIEQAEENLRITQLKYDEGLQRESDLLDAITNLSRARFNHVAVMRTAFANNFRLTRMISGF